MISIAVIAGIIVFGGLFAFLGDRVGMKVGKKRLSMFGLRPKYTSMIITVLTGFFIAGLTLLVLTMLSEYVRTAIFELQNLEKQLIATTSRVKHLTQEITQKAIEYQLLNLKYNEINKNLADVIKQRKQVEGQLQTTQAQYKEAAATLNNTQASLKTAKQDLDLAQKRLNNLTKINEDLKQQITNLTLQEARLSQQIQNLEGSLKSLEDHNRNIQDKPVVFYVGEILVAKIVDPGVNSEKIFAEIVEPLLKSANQIALKRGARIPGKADYALRISTSRVTEVCTQLGATKVKAVLRLVIDKNSIVGEPATIDLELYPNEIVFKNGEVIVETTVTSETTETELRDQLLSLLLRANARAIDKGIITGGQNLRDLVSVADIAKIINTIKKDTTTTKHKVSLTALKDIYRVDALKVKFDVNTVGTGL